MVNESVEVPLAVVAMDVPVNTPAAQLEAVNASMYVFDVVRLPPRLDVAI